MSIILRKQLVVGLTSIIMLIMIADYYFVVPGLDDIVNNLQGWGIVIIGFAMVLGACNLARTHIKNLFQLRPTRGWRVDRWYSAVLLASLLSFIIIGLIKGERSSEFLWMYNTFFAPLASTIYSLTIFWLMSASYRAFRVKNLESAILLACTFISLLGIIPVGAVIWPGFPDLLAWIIEIQVGSSRAVVIGVALGTFALSLRVLFGQELAFIGLVTEEAE